MKVLSLILIIATIASAFEWPWPFNQQAKTQTEDEIEQEQWEEYQKNYGKNYNATESARRFELYKKRKAEVDAHNELYKQNKTSYSEGLNQFSDYTEEERNNMRGSLVANYS